MATGFWEMEATVWVEYGGALRGGQAVSAELGDGNGIFTQYEDCDLTEPFRSVLKGQVAKVEMGQTERKPKEQMLGRNKK